MNINKPNPIALITEGENEIKDKITKLTNNIFQKEYILLDKNWFNKYQNILYNKSNKNVFKIQFLPNFKNKTYDFGNKSYSFSIPTSFVLVKKALIDCFDKNEQNRVQNLIYDVIIGGECLIIKNKKYNNAFYVSQYDINSPFKYINDINYILIYKDTQKLNCELNKILQKGFSSYLDENKIKPDGKSHDIFNSNGEIIGNIIHYTELQYTYTSEMLNIKNVFKSNNLKKEIKKFEMNKILHSIMLCLFQTKQLVNELNNDKNRSTKKMVQLFVDYFQNIQNDCSKVNSKLNSQINPSMTGTYKDIISEMFSKLDKELAISKMKDAYKHGQINQFSETISKNKINEEFKNSSIIQKLFYTTFEIKSICNCGISNYRYESIIFLYINLDKENKNVLISDKMLNYKKPKNIQCHFCGQKIDNKNEIKIYIYPKILIVILEGENYNNFSLINQAKIKINNRLYQLYCLCEKNQNRFYFKRNEEWYANIEKINCKKIETIETTKPVILFYQFYSYIENDRNNINQNINNYLNNKISHSDSNNKQILNMNQMNNYNNMNQMNNYNNMNQMNNYNNMNQMNNNNNMNQMNNYNNMNQMNNNNNMNQMNNNNNNMNQMNNYNKMNNYNNMKQMNNNNNYNIINNNIMNNRMINNFNNMNINMNNNNNFYINGIYNNFKINNMNMNNNFCNNNMNLNKMINFNKKMNNAPLLKSKNILLTFILKGKQLFWESNQNETFQTIILKLENKYNYLKNIKNKVYYYNNQIIQTEYTLKQLNIPDNSVIYIMS